MSTLPKSQADSGLSWGASGFLGWLGPVLGNPLAMPAKQRVRVDEPTVAAWPGECGGYRSEQALIILGEVGSVVLSVQDAELVLWDDDFFVFGAAGTYGEAGKGREETVQNSIHVLRIDGDLPCSITTSGFRAPTPSDTYGVPPLFETRVTVTSTGGDLPFEVVASVGRGDREMMRLYQVMKRRPEPVVDLRVADRLGAPCVDGIGE